MPFDGDPLAFYGKLIIEKHHASLLDKLPDVDTTSRDDEPFQPSDEERFLPQLPVGILGAGIGGLYAALILKSLGVPCEILEATDRVGGRLRTYKFQGKGAHNYFEEGAMRFPLPKKKDGKYQDGIMKRLAELVEYDKLNQGQDPLKDKLISYYYEAKDPCKQGFYYINGITYRPVLESCLDTSTGKPRTSNTSMPSFNARGMGVSDAYSNAGANNIQGDTGSKDGWSALMENDGYSVRGYMASKYLPSYSLNLPPRHLPSDVINWVNLLEDSSAGYDNGLSEAIFEAMAFADVGDKKYSEVDWKCFEGGTETLSKKIKEYLELRDTATPVFLELSKRVTAIGQGNIVVAVPDDYAVPSSVKVSSSHAKVDVVIEEAKNAKARRNLDLPCVTVTVKDEQGPRKYGHVISTIPLPVLRTIDLKGADLNVMQKNALRQLNMGPSIKIAVLFKSNWWKTKLGIIGGQSLTDLPIRTIVYPSYGSDSSPCNVLIASYTWTSDANRLGALALEEEKLVLKELVLRNLAEAHANVDPKVEITYEYLLGEYDDMYVKDWSNDKYTMGAFAEFLPGEFDRLYASLNFPAANHRLHFAGEAISTRHAWVVGALDSAWKAVYEYLLSTGQTKKIEQFKYIWGSNVEWTTPSSLGHDLLHQHIGLTHKAVLAGVI